MIWSGGQDKVLAAVCWRVRGGDPSQTSYSAGNAKGEPYLFPSFVCSVPGQGGKMQEMLSRKRKRL